MSALARSRTGGPSMATMDFTAKPLTPLNSLAHRFARQNIFVSTGWYICTPDFLSLFFFFFFKKKKKKFRFLDPSFLNDPPGTTSQIKKAKGLACGVLSYQFSALNSLFLFSVLYS
jgi:hypothetical protein